MRKHTLKSGFTLTELLVSISILLIITAAVANDITRTQYQAELTETSRLVLGELRNLQARALAATAVKSCNDFGGTLIVCEYDESNCGGSGCDQSLPPSSVGAEIYMDANSFEKFAEVNPVFDNRREESNNREFFGTVEFLTGGGAGTPVRIQSLMADGQPVDPAVVTFERQSGTMRINACDMPPGAPPCGAGSEPKSLVITLIHEKTNQTRSIRLNALTGKMTLE